MTLPITGDSLSITATVPPLSRMGNPIRDYDWGSSSALAQLQSRIPSGRPEAEQWMGAHPAAPSDLLFDDGYGDGGAGSGPSGRLSLQVAVAMAPTTVLGPAVLARFGTRLPFMLKLLAIARPLSVQVHPDADRAREVYRSDGSSPYVDPFAKPEMLLALEPVEALFGFRPAAQAAELIGRLGCERLSGLVEGLSSQVDGVPEDVLLHAALATLISWPLTDRAALVAEIAAGSARRQAAGNLDHPQAHHWLERLIGLHPADPMVLAPLLLDLRRVGPGQTVFVPAGVPHCYLGGLAVEVLAASDNVLRCGLTSKPIQVQELLAVIDCRPLVSSAAPVMTLSEFEIAWRPDVREFQLSRIAVDAHRPGAAVTPSQLGGPQIVLCTRGDVTVLAGEQSLQLTAGASAFVTAEAGPLSFTGEGDVFRAAVGQ